MKINRVRMGRPEAAFCGCALCEAYLKAIVAAESNRQRARGRLRVVKGGKGRAAA